MSLNDLDNCNIETLVDFLFYKPKNPNEKFINGKKFKRATKTPSWL